MIKSSNFGTEAFCHFDPLANILLKFSREMSFLYTGFCFYLSCRVVKISSCNFNCCFICLCPRIYKNNFVGKRFVGFSSGIKNEFETCPDCLLKLYAIWMSVAKRAQKIYFISFIIIEKVPAFFEGNFSSTVIFS